MNIDCVVVVVRSGNVAYSEAYGVHEGKNAVSRQAKKGKGVIRGREGRNFERILSVMGERLRGFDRSLRNAFKSCEKRKDFVGSRRLFN